MKVEYLLTGNEMKEYDRNTIQKFGVPSLVLMEQAAIRAFDVLDNLTKLQDKRCLVLAGTGNNGGDAMALSRLLFEKGAEVTVMLVSSKGDDQIQFTKETNMQFEIIKKMNISIVTKLPSESYDMMIDGIFGVGLNRTISSKVYEIIDEVNKRPALKIALDIPSGVDSSSGKIHGISFQADYTITFAFYKRGLWMYPGVEYCGKIIKKEIGITTESFFSHPPQMYALCKSPREYLPKRKNNGHKGTFGKILVVGGSKEAGGAPLLAAKAAFLSGCGMVRMCIPSVQYPTIFTLLPEAIYDVYEDKEDIPKLLQRGIEWADMIILGPGLGRGEISLLLWKQVIFGKKKPLLIDADGLNLLADEENKKILEQLQKEEETKRTLIMTPHPLEWSRISGISMAETGENEEIQVKDYAKRMKAIIVKKDARTIIYGENMEMAINLSGNHGMATAGSGDVLCGIIAALCCYESTPFDAAVLGVYVHGKAGDLAAKQKGAHSVMATDLCQMIPDTLALE